MNVKKVKVFQIGLGSFGRHGFEKLVELDTHYSEISVELVGVYDRDPEKLELAKKFAEFKGLKVETYSSIERVYSAAERVRDGKVLIYDAGPSELHAEHIYKSLKNNFFHLAEKPPSLSREEHIQEKKMMLDNDVRFTVDFIERENPVVKEALKITENKDIESIEVFRESCMGVEKLLNPVTRSGVKGGAVLDKMCHEAYIMDFVDQDLEVKSVEKNIHMPYGLGSEGLMSVRGGKKSELTEEAASGICQATLSGEAEIGLNASWLGVSSKCRSYAEKVESITDHDPVKTGLKTVGNRSFVDEEARFFVITGERELFGDMLDNKLFDLETGEEIETSVSLHDQLYRVLESSVRCAAGLENNELSEGEIDRFMTALFDISEHVEDSDVYEEVEAANKRVKQLIIETDEEVTTEA